MQTSQSKLEYQPLYDTKIPVSKAHDKIQGKLHMNAHVKALEFRSRQVRKSRHSFKQLALKIIGCHNYVVLRIVREEELQI